ncbi:polysaccharide biosynthesis protein [Bacillaceae bacterium Marseille-Q3522]|nr:polysaccharide biosynthesis protein [Bacillaceae bacterium Marseille-Q3522]
MKPLNDTKLYVRGAFYLTIAALITKILSAIYRIPFQNMVGDVGFYIYQQVYPFYGFLFILSTYGFPVVISKLISEDIKKASKESLDNLIHASLLFLLIFGGFLFLLLFCGAEWLAVKMGDEKLAPLIKQLSFILFIFPFVSCIRGAFQGMGNMVPTAASQVGEQCIRVSVILLAVYFLRDGHYSLYQIGQGALVGAILGSAAALVILLCYVSQQQKWSWLHIKHVNKTAILNYRKIFQVFFTQGFAVCVSSLLLIFLQLADSLNVYAMLVSSGVDSQLAKALKGVYDRGQPLIQLGTVIATSLSLSLVPLIANTRVQSGRQFLLEKIRLSLQISFIVGLGATVGLWSIIQPANLLLFENTSGSTVLALLSTIILLASMIMTVTAILQGLGHTYYPAFTILAGFVIKYLLNNIFVTGLGISGAALASIAALLFMLLVLFSKLYREMQASLFSVIMLRSVCMAAAVMFLVLKLYLLLTNHLPFTVGHDRLFACFQSLSGVAVGGLTYMAIIFKKQLFKADDLALIPFGSKLNSLFTKRNGDGKN